MRVPLTPLQRLALEELRRQGDIEPDMLRIEVRLGPIYSVVGRQLSEEDLGEKPMPTDQNGSQSRRGEMFSPIERTIIRAATKHWQRAADLADKTGQKCNQWFYAILGNLADRGWLESSRDGYRLPDGIDTSEV